MAPHISRHHPLIGTVVELRIDAPDAAADEARRLDDIVVAEMARLERVCSAYDPASELSRWRRGEVHEPSADFCAVMAAAHAHHVASGGVFNPWSGVIGEAWRIAAERGGQAPDDAVLAELAESIREPRFMIDADGRPVATGDCSMLNLNAFAKGWIVDRALELGWVAGVARSLVVNAGGDLAHRGDPPVRVGVENPVRPYDNEPPLTTVELANAGMATSGRARKGFRIGDRWYSHVIDPRTGQPVDHVASVSVIASTAADADALATVLGILPPDESITVAALYVLPDGTILATAAWPRGV